MPPSIFISYRREDSADATGRVTDALIQAFGEEAIFKDVDNLRPGEKFGEVIRKKIEQANIFLCVIGPRWLEIGSAEGRRRLDDPEDWVRTELEIALGISSITVVPVLVSGAAMPNRDQLPQTLRSVAGLNAAFVRSHRDFKKDMDGLIETLRSQSGGGAPVTIRQSDAAKIARGSKRSWDAISNSFDVREYEVFLSFFPGTAEAALAEAHIDALRRYDSMDRSDAAALEAFAATLNFDALKFQIMDQLEAAVAAQEEEFQRELRAIKARDEAARVAKETAAQEAKAEAERELLERERAAREAEHARQEAERETQEAMALRESQAAGRKDRNRFLLSCLVVDVCVIFFGLTFIAPTLLARSPLLRDGLAHTAVFGRLAEWATHTFQTTIWGVAFRVEDSELAAFGAAAVGVYLVAIAVMATEVTEDKIATNFALFVIAGIAGALMWGVASLLSFVIPAIVTVPLIAVVICLPIMAAGSIQAIRALGFGYRYERSEARVRIGRIFVFVCALGLVLTFLAVRGLGYL